MKAKILYTIMLLLAYTFSNAQYPSDRTMIMAKYYTTSTGTDVLRDGTISVYKIGFCNCTNSDDALKTSGSWGIARNGQDWSVEARDTVHTTDTTYFDNMLILDYISAMIDFEVNYPYPSTLTVTLHDAFLGTTFNISTVANVHSKYYYTVTAAPASYASNRFKMVLFNPNGYVAPPPVVIAKEFKVYPNPVNAGEQIHIEFADSVQHEFYLVTTTGIVKYKFGLVSNNSTVKIPEIEKGIYILHDATNNQNKKIILQ